MIDLYFRPTPNCNKISIFLEELGFPNTVISNHIGKSEQYTLEFEAINLIGKVPVVMGERLKRNKGIPAREVWDILFNSCSSDDETQNKPLADKGSRP